MAIGAVAALLILVVFKSSYDITGTWSFIIYSGHTTSDAEGKFIFTGTEQSGDVQITEYWDGPATYAVDGKKVTISHSLFNLIYSGEFTDKNTMSGTATINFGGVSTWNWSATRD